MHVGIKIVTTDRRDKPCFAMDFFSGAAVFLPEDSICVRLRRICRFIISSRTRGVVMFFVYFAFWVILNGKWTTEIAVFGLAFAAIAYVFSCLFMGFSLKTH